MHNAACIPEEMTPLQPNEGKSIQPRFIVIPYSFISFGHLARCLPLFILTNITGRRGYVAPAALIPTLLVIGPPPHYVAFAVGKASNGWLGQRLRRPKHYWWHFLTNNATAIVGPTAWHQERAAAVTILALFRRSCIQPCTIIQVYNQCSCPF